MEVKRGPWSRGWKKCKWMLHQNAANVHWQQHINNQELYGSLPRVSETIRARRFRSAGHCARHNEGACFKSAVNFIFLCAYQLNIWHFFRLRFLVGTWLAKYINPLLRRFCLALFHQEYSKIRMAKIVYGSQEKTWDKSLTRLLGEY